MLYSGIEMPTVFVIAEDWMLRAMLRAQLRELGIDALGMETTADAARALAAGRMPAAVVLETSSGAESEVMTELARRVPLIVVASGTERLNLPEAAAIFHRPVRVGDIVARVMQALRGQAV
jgi:DNA-binding response OmpR family regulator